MCLAFICVTSVSFVSKANTTKCKLTVQLEDESGILLDNLEVAICKVADRTGSDYYPAETFEHSGISISELLNYPSAEAAGNVWDYVNKNKLSYITGVSSNGKVTFESMDQGIWIVACKDGQSHSFSPFLVFLPQNVHGQLVYEVTSKPKTNINIPDSRNVYVIVRWEDNENVFQKRPENVTVHLKLNGNILESIQLSNANGWAHTFENVPLDGVFSVEEESVPLYSTKYSGDAENGFIITNIYQPSEKLPQTGQLWWPIACIGIAGISFVILGIIELRNKKDGEKKA